MKIAMVCIDRPADHEKYEALLDCIGEKNRTWTEQQDVVIALVPQRMIEEFHQDLLAIGIFSSEFTTHNIWLPVVEEEYPTEGDS